MHDLPHHYEVAATAAADGDVDISASGLTTIQSGPPAEFGGSGHLWSPETFLCAAVADCFVLSFRAIATASRFEWTSIRCQVKGVLDRPEKAMLFTELHLQVELEIPPGMDESKARRLLDKSEHACLITNSLTADVHLNAEVRFVA